MKEGFIISLPTVLTLLFVLLKLTGNIDWSWWLVFSPLIVTYAVGIVMAIAMIWILTTVGWPND